MPPCLAISMRESWKLRTNGFVAGGEVARIRQFIMRGCDSGSNAEPLGSTKAIPRRCAQGPSPTGEKGERALSPREISQNVVILPRDRCIQSCLLPLWEKVDRRVSAETDEGCWAGCPSASSSRRWRASPGTPASRARSAACRRVRLAARCRPGAWRRRRRRGWGGGRRAGGGDHGGAEEDGVGGAARPGAAGGVGVELHQQRVAGVAAGDVQGVDVVAVLVQALEDVAQAEGEGDAGAPVEPAEASKEASSGRPEMTPRACGSASGERLPWKSGRTCRRGARSGSCARAARRRGR